MAWESDDRLLDQVEADLGERRFVDLALRLRRLCDDGSEGALVTNDDGTPLTIGGRWDTALCEWVEPRPADLRVHEWTIQDQQLEVIRLPRGVIFVAIFAGRQAGKTHVALQQLVIDALRYAGRDSACVSLTYTAAREPEAAFLSLLAPWWHVRTASAKEDAPSSPASSSPRSRVYVFPHGHTVRFRSREAIDSLRGPSLKTILLDEAARMSETDYLTAVGGGAAAKDLRIMLATTPKREAAWIRRIDAEWDERDEGGARVRHHHHLARLRTADNPRRNQVFLDEIARDLPADLFEQEFNGQLVAPPDAVYARLFARKVHVRRPGTLPDPATFYLQRVERRRDGEAIFVTSEDVTREVTEREFGLATSFVAGWDFRREAVVLGRVFRDYMRIGGQAIATERLWIVGEAIDLQATTDHHARAVAEQFGTDITVITDAMGAHDNAEGRGMSSAAIEILIEQGFAEVRQVASRNPLVEERVRTVNRALRSSRRNEAWPDGETKLFFAPRVAPKLIDALESQRMIGGKPEKDGVHDHVVDALGYLMYALMPVRQSAEDVRAKARAKKSA